MNPPRPSVWIAQTLDVILILAFVIIGRVSHRESLSIVGILITLWPFLVGLAAGWLVTRSWRTPFRIFWNGVTIWLVTVLVAMLLRVASNQGVEIGFVLVAAAFLALGMLGWRAIALLIRRLSRGRR
jgi:hypothetical protein